MKSTDIMTRQWMDSAIIPPLVVFVCAHSPAASAINCTISYYVSHILHYVDRNKFANRAMNAFREGNIKYLDLGGVFECDE
jgi:hypothetical protein